MSITLNWHNELWYLVRVLKDHRKAKRMASVNDLAKLVDNLKRAQSITSRAANDATKHSAIMDAFEQRLNLNSETMSKIEEYEKQMAAMDLGSNGGPALEATFQGQSEAPQSDLVSHSTKGTGRFDQ